MYPIDLIKTYFLKYKMNKPTDITDAENFWHLLPNVTPDTELRKALKSNLTVAKIVKGKLSF